MYWLTGILGFALTIAPFVFGYANNTPALWTSIIIGLSAMTVSWIEGARNDREQWEYWTAGILGIVSIVAPFTLGFSSHVIAMWTSVTIGVLLAVFAGSKLLTGEWSVA